MIFPYLIAQYWLGVLGEYLSVTSLLMVESRNDRAENDWGLGWGGTAFHHRVEKIFDVTGDAQIKLQGISPSSTRREKKGDCKMT